MVLVLVLVRLGEMDLHRGQLLVLRMILLLMLWVLVVRRVLLLRRENVGRRSPRSRMRVYWFKGTLSPANARLEHFPRSSERTLEREEVEGFLSSSRRGS